MTRAIRWAMFGIIAALALGGIVLAYPAAAALSCPQCFGFEPVDGSIFVDREATPDDRTRIVSLVAEGRGNVEAFYGRPEPLPRILACTTEACYRRLGGGGSRGMALMDAGLVLSPRADATIAAHELAHIAFHARIGRIATWERTIPQWFDEGLAVFISEDARYLAPASVSDRCLVEPDGPLPTDRASWIERAESQALYAKAACRVGRWVSRMGGMPQVRAAITRWGEGAPFDAARP
ncbi:MULTISPECIES: hypothetical protein [Methylobacterium]|uniref:Peptidase MA-like domain-containing protein n=1 Tax=Methylobacterium thuringiense TaxID=1003091 RepID=A0ABQ4TMZ8_9HYPH|nr:MULTISPECIES: hypothetical protein [Methylobacterium]TXN23048.1 hypothetical protein FV217_08430 [Methylobacterium sp. WL9]GJE55477.1 hypothetical protein EKPJFOCH_1968 [Methylobacterium thuringiense]